MTSRAGFSLIELSIVLVIVAVMAAGMLSLSGRKLERNKYDITEERLRMLQTRLEDHARAGGMLPCPANPAAALNSAGFGMPDNCSNAAPSFADIKGSAGDGTTAEIWIGAVPTRALNLPDDYMFDGWGNRFRYAIPKMLATNASAFLGYPDTVTAGGYTTGVIQIMDGWGAQILPASTNSLVAFAVISLGRDGKGAFTRTGAAPNVTCPAASTVKGEENCDDDGIFIDARYNDGDVAAQQFDDLIRWKSWYMITPQFP